MQSVSREQIDAALDWPRLIAALSDAFSGSLVAPARHHHSVGAPGTDTATHLLMSAWSRAAPAAGTYLGTKIVNVFPHNHRHGLPAVMGQYLLQSGETGASLAIMDGACLTHWRTAATSALAAKFLARADADHLLMVGAGSLAPALIAAHCSVRPIRKITLWNHRRENAEKMAAQLAGGGREIHVAGELEAAVRQADIVSCATLSRTPLVKGEWLPPGCHLDLVGAFSLTMRECDDAAVQRARVYVDTPAALDEGGDVALALRSGAIAPGHVIADLAALCGGRAQGRSGADEITLFKSIGASIEDLAAAIVVWERLCRRDG